MFSDGQTLHIFKYEVACIELGREAEGLREKTVARIVERAVTNHRESLARSSAEHRIDARVAEIGGVANFSARYFRSVGANRRAARKIELVNGRMDRIDFDRGGDIETGLLESQRQSSGSCEEVDADRPVGFSSRGIH